MLAPLATAPLAYPGQLTQGRSVIRGTDILAAFLLACSYGPLKDADNFHETDQVRHPKFFRDEDLIFDDVEIPYLVAAVDLVGEHDPPTYDGDTVQPVTIRADIFADTKAESIRLAHAVLLYFRDDPDRELSDPISPPLKWGDGDGIELFRTVRRSDPETIGAQWGPGGTVVQGSRVRIQFMTQFNIYGVR